MEFNNLRTLSNKLENNIQLLESKLRNTANILFGEENVDSEGMKILKDLHEKWEKICEELKEANCNDEEEIKELNEDYQSCNLYMDEMKMIQKKCENILVQKNLLQLSTEGNVNLSGVDPISETLGALQVSPGNSTFFAVPTVPANSTFLSAPSNSTFTGTPDNHHRRAFVDNKENQNTNVSDIENTMLEFQKKDVRKTFVVKK